MWISATENWFGEADVTIVTDDQVDDPELRRVGRSLQRVTDNGIPVGNILQPRRDQTAELRFNVVVAPVNDPPVWQARLRNVNFDEDIGPWIIADMDTLFSDIENDRLFFSCRTPEMISWEIDADQILILDAQENYNGADLEISLIADDRADRDRSFVRNLRSTYGRNSQARQLRNSRDRSGLCRDDITEGIIHLTINAVNDRPYWVEQPSELIEAMEGNLVEIIFQRQAIPIAMCHRLSYGRMGERLVGVRHLSRNS
ncbi:MAG TPA: Ig-like domain-containing protein [Anaerolineae bacterium]|nr:Ig-like domain-containing protein [Anaerolineae bacterium]